MRTLSMRRAVWETYPHVEYSLCLVRLQLETHVTCIELGVVNTTEHRMGQNGSLGKYHLLLM